MTKVTIALAHITLLGGVAVAWPLAARSQQAALPVVGYLNFGSPETVRTVRFGGYTNKRGDYLSKFWCDGQSHSELLVSLHNDRLYVSETEVRSPARSARTCQ
jgi:hypothetical protein